MKGLTPRQSQILNYINDYRKEHGFSPSYRDIQKHFQFSSLGSVTNHLSLLKQKGMIEYETYGKRSIVPQVSEGNRPLLNEVELPFIGYISCENHIETFTHSQTLGVPQYLVPHPSQSYILRAKGSSLQEELIADGDLLIVEAKAVAADKEIVIALINNQDLIVKRYFSDGEYVKLTSYNPDIQPMIIKETSIVTQAVVVGVIRMIQ